MISRGVLTGFARGALGLSSTDDPEILPLGGRGSDRTYFRVRTGADHSAILVHYDPKRTENAYFADIAAFLTEIDVPVPRVIRHDGKACLILMEDLGEEDLWSFRAQPWEIRGALYRKTLRIVSRLHSLSPDAPAARGVRLMEPFGPKLYRWEHSYFLEHFVKGLCAVDLPSSVRERLDRELGALADRVSTPPLRFVHRDLQSQNVMIREGNPVLIDFQGMRLGSPFYDLGSLLCDPYVRFAGDERAQLLAYYCGLAGGGLDWHAFEERFWEASAQRLMQALGAYGFLSLKKGLPAYLEHVPGGLDNLLDATGHVEALRHLRETGQACKRALSGSRSSLTAGLSTAHEAAKKLAREERTDQEREGRRVPADAGVETKGDNKGHG